MSLISYSYRAGRVTAFAGTLDGTGTPALIPGTLANNREAGTGYLALIHRDTLSPCRPINLYSLDKSRLTKAEIMNQLSKSNPPLPIKLQGRDIVSPKGRPRYLNLPTGKTEGEKT